MLLLLFAFFVIAVRRFERLEHELIYWCSLIVVTQIIGLTIGISGIVGFIVLITAIAVRWLIGDTLRTEELRCILPIAIPFMLVASMPARFIDAGRYYDQTIRWFAQGMPAGLANFDLYLIQASGAHSLESIITSVLGVGQNELVPLLCAYLIARSLQKVKLPKVLWLAVVLVLGVLMHFAQTSSPDLLVMALVIAAASVRRDLGRWSLVLLITIIPLIKLSASFVVLPLLLVLIRRRDYNGIIAASMLSLLLLLKFWWLSGWVPVFGTFNVDWHIPQAAIGSLSSDVSIDNYSETYSPFVIPSLNLRFNDLVIGILFLSLVALKHYYQRAWSSSAVSIVVFITWLFIIPQGRILLPYLLFVLFTIRVDLLKNEEVRPINDRVVSLTILAVGLISVLPNWTVLNPNNERWSRFFDYSGYSRISWLSPSEMWHIDVDLKYLNDGFMYYKPNEAFECFDAPFPCNARILKDYQTDSLYIPVYKETYFSYRAIERSGNEHLLEELNAVKQFE